MKKNNKGFSLVELIIVIAIMAILAGALAPALIKYINKSRYSTDVSNADTIRTSIQTALSNEDAYDALLNKNNGEVDDETISTLKNSYGTFSSELESVLGSATLTTKYSCKGCEFIVYIDAEKNIVTVKNADGDVLSPDSSSNNNE